MSQSYLPYYQSIHLLFCDVSILLMLAWSPELLKLFSHSCLHWFSTVSGVCLLPWKRPQYVLLHAGARVLSSGGHLKSPRPQLPCGLLRVLVGPWTGAPVDSNPCERSLETNAFFFERFFNSPVGSALLHHLIGIIMVEENLLVIYMNFLLPGQLQDGFFNVKLQEVYNDGPWSSIGSWLLCQGSMSALNLKGHTVG